MFFSRMATLVSERSTSAFFVSYRVAHKVCAYISSLFICISICITVDAAGSEKITKRPRFIFTAHTLQDNETNLMWALNGAVTDQTYSFIDAEEYIFQLNKERFAGHRDWRLPTREELMSLVEHVKKKGFMGKDPATTVAEGMRRMGIVKAKATEYWTATTNLFDASEAWYVSLVDGTSCAADRTIYFSIWPVRSIRGR